MAFKKWNIAEADKEKASAISEKFNIDPFVAYLLAARGKVSEIAVSEFLSDEIRLSDPFDLLDMERAVERIEKAVESGEKITVYGDYDCDGVTSTVLLYSFCAIWGQMLISIFHRAKPRATGLITRLLNRFATQAHHLS